MPRFSTSKIPYATGHDVIAPVCHGLPCHHPHMPRFSIPYAPRHGLYVITPMPRFSTVITAILRFSTPLPPCHGFPRRYPYGMVFISYTPCHGFPSHIPHATVIHIVPMPWVSTVFPCFPRRKLYAMAFHIPCFHVIAPIPRFPTSSPSHGTVFHVMKPMPRFSVSYFLCHSFPRLQPPFLVFSRHNSHVMAFHILPLPHRYHASHVMTPIPWVSITPPTCLMPRFSTSSPCFPCHHPNATASHITVPPPRLST